MKKTLLIFQVAMAAIFSGLKAQSLLWAKNMGGLGKFNYGYSIAVDANGNSYTTGYFGGAPDFDPGPGSFSLTSAGNDDIFVMKLNSAGNFIWARRIGGTAIDHAVSIALDSKQNVYLTGTFQGTVDFDPGVASYSLTSAGGDDDFICKLDSSGNFKWARRVGNANVDGASAIATDPSDNVLVTGFFHQQVDFDPGPGTSNVLTNGFSDCFVLKLDSTGAYVWAKNIGGGSDDSGNAITTDASGNIYTTGSYGYIVDLDPGTGTTTVQAVGGSDIFISKLSSSGVFVWGGSMGGSNIDAGNAITVDTQGNIYTTGYFWGVGDFDPGTATFSITPIGDKDIYVSKINPTGNLLWVKVMGGTGIDAANSIKVDGTTGNVYTAGFYQGAADFDPGAGTDMHTPVWGADMFVSCLDPNGNYVSAKVIGGGVDDGASSFGMDAGGNLYVTGNFGGVVDFDPGSGITNLTSSGADDIFVMKMGQAAVGIKEALANAGTLFIYPNPSKGNLNIVVSGDNAPCAVRVVNMAGQIVMEVDEVNAGNFSIDLTKHPNGVYLLEAKHANTISRAKLVKVE